MSFFARLFRLKRKDSVKALEPQNKSPNESHEIAVDGTGSSISGQSKRGTGFFKVNPPINQDLCGSHAELEQLEGKKIDFDFTDLAGLDGDAAFYSEGEVLAFNPLKPFSKPVELDQKRLQAQGFVTPYNANKLLGNTFRMIKRPLLNNVMGKGATVLDNANLIMVTSSLSGEGKTFSAINLAISIAMERDKQVLLIDADVNKPSHHDVFGFDADVGLTDYLTGKVSDMSRVLYKSSIPSLTLMPAGTKTLHATELLASDAMERFVAEISSKYENRVIIFDSPPLLLLTEASVLASHMGQVVVVVRAEETSHQEVKKSLSMLSNTIVLLLLNQAYEKNQIGNYGYYKDED
jgi:protein-tyrosine kinase